VRVKTVEEMRARVRPCPGWALVRVVESAEGHQFLAEYASGARGVISAAPGMVAYVWIGDKVVAEWAVVRDDASAFVLMPAAT
jgi:hypothetical protein